MTAIYPNNVRNFLRKTDFTDIVNAGDVNVAYDEIQSVETILGVNPQQEVIDNTLSSWNTVSSRISAVRQGVSNPYCEVTRANDITVSGTVNTVSYTNKSMDTHGIWTGGNSLVCPRSGVYTFSYTIQWYSPTITAPAFSSNGYIKSSMTVVGNTHPFIGVTASFPAGWSTPVEQTACKTMYWQKGTAVRLDVAQNVLATLPYTALVSVLYERGPATVNNT